MSIKTINILWRGGEFSFTVAGVELFNRSPFREREFMTRLSAPVGPSAVSVRFLFLMAFAGLLGGVSNAAGPYADETAAQRDSPKALT